MRVELERETENNGRRSVTLAANDRARKPETIQAWIKTLQLALRWLKEKEDDPAGNS